MIVDISTSGAKKFGVMYAHSPVRLRNVILLPSAALAADPSNYWKISIVKYYEGVESGIPIDERTVSFTTDVRSLTVGTPIVLPQLSRMDEWLAQEESLYIDVAVGAGSPSALAATAQVDVIGGR